MFPGDYRGGVRTVVLLAVTAPATDAKSRTLSVIRCQRVPIGRGGSHRGSCLMTCTSSAVAIWGLCAADMTRAQVIRIPIDREKPGCLHRYRCDRLVDCLGHRQQRRQARCQHQDDADDAPAVVVPEQRREQPEQ